MLVTLNRHKGFTLLEMAIALFIVFLLLGSMMGPLSARRRQQDRIDTKSYMETVREAMIGYSIINGRMPCPDCPDTAVGTCGSGGTANDGIEDMYVPASSTTGDLECRTSVGNIPWVDLQVDEHDSWKHHLTYEVTSEFADETDGTTTANCNDTVTVGISFELCATGDINIYNAYAAPGSYSGTPDVAANVVAVLVSHGENEYDSSQTDVEVENYERNPVNPNSGANILTSYISGNYSSKIFVSKDYDAAGTDAFDDIVIWLSPNILMNRMVMAGRLP